MSRRSLRLQQAGYYGENGQPVISYKADSHNTSGRKPSLQSLGSSTRLGNPGDRENSTSQRRAMVKWLSTSLSTGTTENGSGKLSGFLRGIYNLVFLLLLVYGITIITQMQLSNAQVQLGDTRVQLEETFMQIRETHMQLKDTNSQLTKVQRVMQSLKDLMDKHMPYSHNIPNFASDSLGARVLHISERYIEKEESQWTDFLHGWFSSEPPAPREPPKSVILQGFSSLQPGNCWCFSGDQGYAIISLSQGISISHVTLGHTTKSRSNSGKIASAPRKFSVFGMKTVRGQTTYLGTLTYDQDGSSFQTFTISNPDNVVFRYVNLQIESNWGHDRYTCLYSFKVHGKLSK